MLVLGLVISFFFLGFPSFSVPFPTATPLLFIISLLHSPEQSKAASTVYFTNISGVYDKEGTLICNGHLECFSCVKISGGLAAVSIPQHLTPARHKRAFRQSWSDALTVVSSLVSVCHVTPGQALDQALPPHSSVSPSILQLPPLLSFPWCALQHLSVINAFPLCSSSPSSSL